MEVHCEITVGPLARASFLVVATVVLCVDFHDAIERRTTKRTAKHLVSHTGQDDGGLVEYTVHPLAGPDLARPRTLQLVADALSSSTAGSSELSKHKCTTLIAPPRDITTRTLCPFVLRSAHPSSDTLALLAARRSMRVPTPKEEQNVVSGNRDKRRLHSSRGAPVTRRSRQTVISPWSTAIN
jgi:hypothetical protein